jgi:hypothetical protein
MTPVDDYRAKANEFMARAQGETNPALRVQYETLAQSYLRLADQAERNSRSDLVYETPRVPTPGTGHIQSGKVED